MQTTLFSKLQKIALTLFVSITLFVPHAAMADECSVLKAKIANTGANIAGTLPEYCSYRSVYNKFINLSLFAIGIVAVLAVIYGGYLYITARGNSEQAKQGRQVLTWAIVGLIVVLAAAIIVNVVVKALVDNPFV